MKAFFTRESYIPTGAIKITPKGANAEFHIYDGEDGIPRALCFIGRSAKPAWHFRFKSLEAREKRIAKEIETRKEIAEAKAKRRAEMNKPHDLKVGDIMVASWGYGQTNVDFLEITKVPSKCYVMARPICSKRVEGSGESHGMSDMVVADTSNTSEPKRYKVIEGRIKLHYSASASLWDGKPRYRSWYH